jgi:DNA polymerase (family 10)
VNEEDLKGDPHVHTLWSDGFSSIEEMVLSAKEKGLRWIAITDHSAALAVAGGLDTARLRSQMVEIDDVNRKQTSVRVLKGVEAEILADGTVDVPWNLVDELDIVIGSLHLSMRQSREEITRRYLKAIRHPRVHIIAHPTGRLLGQRQGMDADWEVIFEEASRTGTILEINANPYRLDLPDYLAALANEKGCLFSIGSDAHRTSQMELLHFGVSVARRAWINKDRIVNTWELDKLLDWAKSKPDRL